MKTVILFLSFFALSPAAFASKSLKLNCAMTSELGTIATDVRLNAGMVDQLDCPGFICDGGNFAVTMNYNSAYQDVSVTIVKRSTGEISATTHRGVKVGSSVELTSANQNTGKYLRIDCEVAGVLKK